MKEKSLFLQLVLFTTGGLSLDLGYRYKLSVLPYGIRLLSTFDRSVSELNGENVPCFDRRGT